MMRNIPAEIAENWKEFFPEHEDCEEVLVQQESVYLSIQENGRNRGSTSGGSHISDNSRLHRQGCESSNNGSTNLQVALDEALARSLQELEDDFEDLYLPEHNVAEAGTRIAQVSTDPSSLPDEAPNLLPARAIAQNLTQEDIDPDNMTNEQLQSLGESIGSENAGVPKELISRLPTFKNKSGIFSKKKKGECVICQMEYSTDLLTKLPCAHLYHSKCIKRWLKDHKQCPICKEVVQDKR